MNWAFAGNLSRRTIGIARDTSPYEKEVRKANPVALNQPQFSIVIRRFTARDVSATTRVCVLPLNAGVNVG